MPFHHATLPNGLTVLGETNPSALSVGVAFWVRTGARDEMPEFAGVSHFLEHMVFKGTERRDSMAVNRDFSLIGADNNAWTSEESTVFHAAVLPEFLPQLVDVLADMMRPSLREADFDTEKTVILDEIAKYAVQPWYAAFDAAREQFFGKHPLSYSVLGSTESITALPVGAMREYFDRRYVAGNIHAVAAGNFDFSEFQSLVEKACGHWPAGNVGRVERRSVLGERGFSLKPMPKDKVAQEYVIRVSPAPAADSDMRYSAAVLSTALGDATSSRLFWALVDPGKAESASLGYDEADGTGAFYLTIVCPPESAEECLAIAETIFAETQNAGLTADEVRQTKIRLTSREVRANEITSHRMRSIGKDWNYLKAYRTLDDELRAWDAVTTETVKAAIEAFPLTGAATVALGPLETWGA